jgi:hypothetical protein
MTVMIVQALQMVMQLKITVVLVIVIALMTVYKIVLEHGVEI